MNRHILTSILLLAAFIAVQAQIENPDAVYLEQTREYTLHADGSRSYHYSHSLQLNTYYAFHSLYGEDFIVYDPAFQKLEISKSVTTMADGKKVASPANAYNELLPGFAANVPAWNRLREMVVTHTALERGAVVDFDYTLNTRKGYTPAWSLNEPLLMNSPVKKLTLVVNVPSGAAFSFKQFNIAREPVITKQGGTTTYTWQLNDLPAALREDFRSPEMPNRPRLVFIASVKKTDPVAAMANQEAFKCEATPQLAAAARDLTKGIGDPVLSALKIQEMVASDLNTYNIPMQYSAYSLRTPAEVWKSNGGTEAEKVLLFTALLRSLGLQANPVAVVADRYYSPATCSPALFEKMLVQVALTGREPLLLSATQADQQDQGLLLAGKRLITLRQGKSQPSLVLPAVKNTAELKGSWNLDKNLNAAGTLNLRLAGRLNPALRLLKDTAYLSKLLGEIPMAGKVSDVKMLSQSGTECLLSFASASATMAAEKGGLVFLKIPSIPSASESWRMTELTALRSEPLEVPWPLNESYDLTFNLPQGFTLAAAPAPVDINSQAGSLKMDISCSGNVLHIKKSLNIANTAIAPEQYASFRSMMIAWRSKAFREIVLKPAD